MIDFMLITRVRSPGLVCIRMGPHVNGMPLVCYWWNPRTVLVKIMLAGGFHWQMFLINYVVCVPSRLLCGSHDKFKRVLRDWVLV